MTAPMSTRRALTVLAAAAAVALVTQGTDAKAQTIKQTITNAAVTPAVQGLTADQCKILKGHLIQHIKVVGRQNISDAFYAAMGDLAFKKGCATPVSIPVDTKLKDLDVFNSIGDLMEQTQGINIRKMGISTVIRTASLQ